MRQKRLVLDGTFCETNLYKDGPQTVEEARKLGKSPCPNFDKCNTSGFLHPTAGHQCIMEMARQVACFVLKQGNTVEEEMRDFAREGFKPPKGWIFSPDRKNFETVCDHRQAFRLIEKFAHITLGDNQEDNPSYKVGPDFNDILVYASTPDGMLDLSKLESLEGRYGYNGGRGCDVRSGPCSCGAWH